MTNFALALDSYLLTLTQDFVLSPSGLLLPQKCSACKSYPIVIDLFCGAGGFSLGFMEAGFQVAAAADNDVNAALTYMYNLGAYPCEFHYGNEADRTQLEKAAIRHEKQNQNKWDSAAQVPFISGGGWRSAHPEIPGCPHFYLGDICQLEGKELLGWLGLERGEIDVIIGGPPCQGFSRINRNRSPLDPRNQLIFEFARLICEINPKFFVLENVPEILKMTTPEGIPVLDAFCQCLDERGYSSYQALKSSLKSQHNWVSTQSTSPAKTKSRSNTGSEYEQLDLF
ncbi:DNA cytosine methyltransferase [Laspinema olomoucense]|uniref:DNA (cytosine-5-)-methyltransferase n=1 Tax=Laspinema olomoucense D3b TaxID=2953688 RepID=A0ABT2NFH5_9CYAN|nr:DNA cytosine methyltransferase [Laspinema sp. D3b]MCT7981460.1 DNA cytosine methyltransferase [Laspinema sp. D3b]